jgi:hypothetical protein
MNKDLGELDAAGGDPIAVAQQGGMATPRG